MPLAAALLVFLFFVVLVVGIWWVSQTQRTVRERLKRGGTPSSRPEILLPEQETLRGLAGVLRDTGLPQRLGRLAAEAGYKATTSDLTLVTLACAAVGGAAAWLRTGGLFWGLLTAVATGSIPTVYLLYKRARRIIRFQTQFPDALDMITRAIRAGNALSGAIKLVGEEMPDPTGAEFRQVDDEIRLGTEPSEALFGLETRMPTEDVRFFCTAIRIQRSAGGNLAEILDRLAEVIRERFKILSYARVLSSQHKWSAICVGLSPVIFGLMFQLLNPGYFDVMLTDPIGPVLIGAGLVLEAIGFFTIWRIAQIKV
jgi:tight adherence protein B